MNTRKCAKKLLSALWAPAAAVVAQALLPAAFLGSAMAAPQGGQVIAGKASITRTGLQTAINASSASTIINFQSFNIAGGESVIITQPSAASRMLDRVIGSGATTIDGSLQSNGQVYLVNPQGIIIGSNAWVNTAKFVAAGGTIANADFLAGNDNFTNVTGNVSNAGTIQAQSVMLVGAQVLNSGTVNSAGGSIVMAAGSDVYIGNPLDPTLVKVTPSAVASRNPSGTGDVYSLAIQNTGTATAQTIVLNGAGGSVQVSGKLDASSQTAGTKGGQVVVTGGQVSLTTATVNASGPAGGGSIKIGGDWHGATDILAADDTTVSSDSTLLADATNDGNGGQVVVWSGSVTNYAGAISAQGAGTGTGGSAEVSSADHLNFTGTSNLMGPGGLGSLLLDPANVLIESDDGGTEITGNVGANDAGPSIIDPASIILGTPTAPGTFGNSSTQYYTESTGLLTQQNVYISATQSITIASPIGHFEYKTGTGDTQRPTVNITSDGSANSDEMPTQNFEHDLVFTAPSINLQNSIGIAGDCVVIFNGAVTLGVPTTDPNYSTLSDPLNPESPANQFATAIAVGNGAIFLGTIDSATAPGTATAPLSEYPVSAAHPNGYQYSTNYGLYVEALNVVFDGDIGATEPISFLRFDEDLGVKQDSPQVVAFGYGWTYNNAPGSSTPTTFVPGPSNITVDVSGNTAVDGDMNETFGVSEGPNGPIDTLGETGIADGVFGIQFNGYTVNCLSQSTKFQFTDTGPSAPEANGVDEPAQLLFAEGVAVAAGSSFTAYSVNGSNKCAGTILTQSIGALSLTIPETSYWQPPWIPADESTAHPGQGKKSTEQSSPLSGAPSTITLKTKYIFARYNEDILAALQATNLVTIIGPPQGITASDTNSGFDIEANAFLITPLTLNDTGSSVPFFFNGNPVNTNLSSAAAGVVSKPQAKAVVVTQTQLSAADKQALQDLGIHPSDITAAASYIDNFTPTSENQTELPVSVARLDHDRVEQLLDEYRDVFFDSQGNSRREELKQTLASAIDRYRGGDANKPVDPTDFASYVRSNANTSDGQVAAATLSELADLSHRIDALGLNPSEAETAKVQWTSNLLSRDLGLPQHWMLNVLDAM